MATISNNDIKIRYVVETANLEAAAQAFDKLSTEEKQALADLKKFNQESNNTNKSMGELGSIAGKVGGVLGGLFAVGQIKQFATAVIETTVKFEAMRKAIDFASGSMEAGAKNFEFLRDLSQKLGLDLRSTAEGYKTFASASNLAGQSSQETNRQFAAVAKAAQVMGLSAEDTKGAFLALGQMMSKGNVQAEELRGQLGERLVGAFGIAAKAMGVTTGELNKMLQKGQVLAADFLPKFATELENTFGKGNAQVTTIAASQNRFNSAIDELILSIGNKLNPFLKGAYDLAAGIATQLSSAGGGAGAKKATDEQIAAKRVEAELAQKILDISIKQGVFISRQSAARSLLMEIDQRQTNAQLKQVDARLSKDNLRLEAATKEYNVLKEQEKIYERIAGVIVNTPPPPKPVDPKELKKEYEERLKMLELLKQQRILMGELYGDPLARIGAEKAFLEAKLKLQKQYQSLFTDIEIGNTNLERLNAEKDFYKQAKDLRMENYKDAVETEDNLRKRRLQIMQQGIKDNKEANDRIAANNAEMLRIYNREQDEKVAIIQKVAEITQTISDAGFNIYSQRLNNELTLLNRRYDKEIELADGNQQKIDEIEARRAEKQREIQLKQFKAEQAAAVARVIFETASMIAKWSTNPVTAPLAALSIFAQAAQIGAILAQPVPEFAEGTKGVPFKGGKAIVGERGVEKVVTESGKVYFTPPTATLVDLPKGAQVVPNHALSRQELFLASHYSKGGSTSSPVVGKLDELGSILKSLPITQVSMDEKGFEKFIRTPRRTTKILNNRFRSDNL